MLCPVSGRHPVSQSDFFFTVVIKHHKTALWYMRTSKATLLSKFISKNKDFNECLVNCVRDQFFKCSMCEDTWTEDSCWEIFKIRTSWAFKYSRSVARRAERKKRGNPETTLVARQTLLNLGLNSLGGELAANTTLLFQESCGRQPYWIPFKMAVGTKYRNSLQTFSRSISWYLRTQLTNQRQYICMISKLCLLFSSLFISCLNQWLFM